MDVADPCKSTERAMMNQVCGCGGVTDVGMLTVLPHHQHISALVLRGQEDLGHHNKDLTLAGRVDVPNALHICRVITGVVRGLDVAHKLAHLAATLPV